jgi:hypothetical protein
MAYFEDPKKMKAAYDDIKKNKSFTIIEIKNKLTNKEA